MSYLNIQRTFYKVSDFLSWYKNGALALSPEFQRRSVWKTGTKSFLIDTIVKGLPIPSIFLRDKGTDLKTFNPQREVIDGQQRLRTVIAYVEPSLLLDFNPDRDSFTVQSVHNAELADKRFRELTLDMQSRILDYEFNVYILPSYADDREVIQIFRRMNSTNYTLTPQELRNASWFGEFKTSMYQLAAEHLLHWRKWKIFSEDDIARMTEVELTSELALLILSGEIKAKSKKAIDTAYKSYDETFPARKEMEFRFETTMDTIDSKLGREMGRSPFSRRSLIYSLFACFYDLTFGLSSSLDMSQPNPITPEQVATIKLAGERIQNRSAPEQVLNAITRRGTNRIERTNLYNYLCSLTINP